MSQTARWCSGSLVGPLPVPIYSKLKFKKELQLSQIAFASSTNSLKQILTGEYLSKGVFTMCKGIL